MTAAHFQAGADLIPGLRYTQDVWRDSGAVFIAGEPGEVNGKPGRFGQIMLPGGTVIDAHLAAERFPLMSIVTAP